jgi:hypothetical protein
MISSISSLFIERLIVKKNKNLRNGLNTFSILSKTSQDNFKKIYADKYGMDFEEKDFRNCICHVENFRPNNYGTAFVFLSFYGMARNYSFTFLILFIVELIISFCLHQLLAFYVSIAFLLSSLIMFDQYYRFAKYFKGQILSSFIDSIKSSDEKRAA